MTNKKSNSRERFIQLLQGPENTISLAEAALLIAAEEYPGLDVDIYLRRLDELAKEARPFLQATKTPQERVQALLDFIYFRQKFKGNEEDYFDPRNSFLNEVVERRTGIPITLAVLVMEVGKRLDLNIEGISFPGHFLIKYMGEEKIIMDPFAGRILNLIECEALLHKALGPTVPFDQQFLKAAYPKEILVRMLQNLKQIYLNSGKLDLALRYCNLSILVNPNASHEWRDRGLIYQELECFGAALKDFERFLKLAPDDVSANVIKDSLPELRQKVGQIQ